jgi:hypothetical protein
MDEFANLNIYSHAMVRPFEAQKSARDAETELNVSIAIRLFRVANLMYARSDNEGNTILTVHELPHCNNKPVAGSLSTSEHTTVREGVH